jgi:hypothetical protein
MGRRPQLSGPIREYLRTGDYGSAFDPARPPFDYDAYELAGAVLRGGYAEIEDLWARHGASLLEDWATAHPGCRPFAWWVCAAREPRRVHRGVELLARGMVREDVWWRPRFGVPFFVQARPAGFTGYPTIEAEAAYLDRLGLLADAERARVPTEGWEPTAINPFLVAHTPASASTNGAPRARRRLG